VARPAVLMVAAPVFDECHATELVRSFVLPSEYVPVASNCTLVPAGADEFAGVTVMEFSAACPELTVKVVEPETLPEVAEMVVL